VVLDTPSPLIVGPSEVLIDRCQRSRIPLFESELSCSPTDDCLYLFARELVTFTKHSEGYGCLVQCCM